MKDDVRFKNAAKRKDEFEEKAVAKQKRKEEKKRGVEEAGVEDEAGRRPKRKMENEPGSASGVKPAAGNEEPLATTFGDVQMSSARGPKRSGEDIEELEAVHQ